LTGVTRAPFGSTPTGEPVDRFILTNQNGVELRVISYGGIITALRVPDRDGEMADIVLGHESVDAYAADTSNFGAIIGRVVNRISGSRFTIHGREYRVAANRPPNSLHGGIVGFDRVVWRVTPIHDAAGDSGIGLELRHLSPDGDQGYPGNLDVVVRYVLTERNELIVDYHASTDRATPVNLSQHSYFNLAGHRSGDILGHTLWINADGFTPMREDLTPTGSIERVDGTPLDFRTPVAIGARIGADHEQLRIGHGYDHNFVINRSGPGLVHAAQLVDPGSGRTLDVHTSEIGMQLYTGNYIEETVPGKEGWRYGRHAGLSLETQHFPDSPNQPAFPSIILRPRDEYRSRTMFRFGVARRE
jgi:aldose 1-epimerase